MHIRVQTSAGALQKLGKRTATKKVGCDPRVMALPHMTPQHSTLNPVFAAFHLSVSHYLCLPLSLSDSFSVHPHPSHTLPRSHRTHTEHVIKYCQLKTPCQHREMRAPRRDLRVPLCLDRSTVQKSTKKSVPPCLSRNTVRILRVSCNPHKRGADFPDFPPLQQSWYYPYNNRGTIPTTPTLPAILHQRPWTQTRTQYTDTVTNTDTDTDKCVHARTHARTQPHNHEQAHLKDSGLTIERKHAALLQPLRQFRGDPRLPCLQRLLQVRRVAFFIFIHFLFLVCLGGSGASAPTPHALLSFSFSLYLTLSLSPSPSPSPSPSASCSPSRALTHLPWRALQQNNLILYYYIIIIIIISLSPSMARFASASGVSGLRKVRSAPLFSYISKQGE
jgi:hypothetical protein